MRLRHRKNAEKEILNYPIVIPYDKCIGKLYEPHTIFGNNHSIHLELGMGKGRFISELSIMHPEINFIGIEKSATIVLKASDKLYKNIKLSELASTTTNVLPALSPIRKKIMPTLTPNNLRFLCIDIAKLNGIFTPNSIDKIYLNFSDPWPKKRHESRRLTHHNFLTIYEKLLKNNGIIEFKTDNKELFDFSLEEIKHSNFNLINYTYDLHNDKEFNKDNIMTEYEEKFSKLGNKICKFIIKSK